MTQLFWSLLLHVLPVRHKFCAHQVLSRAIPVAALAWGIVYRVGLWATLSLVLFMILRDFLLSGIIVATVLW